MIRKHPTKCIVGACVRNCMPYLPETLQNIKRLESLFDEIYVVVAFDQSDDHSLDVLREHKPLFAHLDILVNPYPLSPMRTQRIADARNAILEYTDAVLSLDEYPFLIMMDMDDVCVAPLRVETIDRYIDRTDWDALSFNRAHYYDIWALSVDPYLVSCWHLSGDHNTSIEIIGRIQTHMVERLRETPPDDLVEVYSAFAGLAIYRRAQFRECLYATDFPLNILTPEQFRQTQKTMAEWPFPNINVFDYTGIIRGDCEHRAFHFEAIAKHGAKIRVSPHTVF